MTQTELKESEKYPIYVVHKTPVSHIFIRYPVRPAVRFPDIQYFRIFTLTAILKINVPYMFLT